MRDFLPVGLKGLLVASFFAAYMSTIATHLNWGGSYLVSDFYKRFLVKERTEKHYVSISRLTTILLMIVSIVVTLLINRISGAWEFILQCGAGLGLVLILRWFWWRINAWSEISAMITPFIIYPVLIYYDIEFPISLYYLTGITTIVWLTITILTKPTDEEKLISFYKLIHPGGILWKKISSKLPEVKGDEGFFKNFINWILGIIFVYSSLFLTGALLFEGLGEVILYLTISIISFILVYINITKMKWS
jgi:uncharacterized sodium:solute symporter family permease YidK